MPSYQYEMQSSGGGQTGLIQADSVAEAAARLRAQGVALLNVTPFEGDRGSLFDRLRSLQVTFGPGLKDVQNFTNQMAVMIKAGINIRNAIEGVSEQIENPKFKKVIEQIKHDVEAGMPFSEALSRHPKVFSPLYVNMVRASELSGQFGHMLERIADYQSQQLETRSMVRGAMIYPIIIGVMAVATTIFLLTFVLPRFTELFAGKEALLPKPTLMLMALSKFLRTYWYVVAGGAGVLIAGFVYAISTPMGREVWDRFKLRMPLFRRMFRALCISRGLHTMGELIGAGVPMLDTLAITAEVSGNAVYSRLWQNVEDAVRQGEKIADPLSRQAELPRNVVQMVAAGEESGRLGEVLRDVSTYYAKELRNTIKAVTAMIEPLMIVIMGLIVGFIAMSVILPIFKMSSLVK